MNRHVQCLQQRFAADGLAQELIETDIDGAHAELQRAATGESDQAHAEKSGILSHTACRLETVQTGHVEIEKCSVGPHRLAQLDSSGAIAARMNLHSCLMQHGDHRRPEKVVVFCVNELEFTRRNHLHMIAAFE